MAATVVPDLQCFEQREQSEDCFVGNSSSQ